MRYLVPLVVLIFLLPTACQSIDLPTAPNEAAFAVACYDVGASALQGHPGISKVDKGWYGGQEVNRVVYDPQQVTVRQMEEWLIKAGTYRETLAPTGSADKPMH